VLSYSNYFGRKPVERFAIGRFARLYPLYIASLLFMAALLYLTARQFHGPFFFESIFFLSDMGFPPYDDGINMPSWSIPTEVWISVLFFFVCRKSSMALAIGCLVLCLGIVVAVPDLPNMGRTNLLWVFNVAPLRGVVGFTIGVAAFAIFERTKGRWSRIWTVGAYIGPLLLAVIFCLPTWTEATYLAFCATTFVTLLCLAHYDRNVFLANRVSVGAGAISYSVYLLHVPIFALMAVVFGNGTMHGISKLLYFPTVILVSIACHRYFEMPAQAWVLRRVGYRGSQDRGELSVPAPSPLPEP